MARASTIVLPIAIMAFAIVSFLLLVEFSTAPAAHGPIKKTPNPATMNTNKALTNTSLADGECRPTGCSGQVCSDENIVTDCMYRSEYACYASAVCERQAGGQCGWTNTETLTACIDAARAGAVEPSAGQVQGAEDSDPIGLPTVLDISDGS